MDCGVLRSSLFIKVILYLLESICSTCSLLNYSRCPIFFFPVFYFTSFIRELKHNNLDIIIVNIYSYGNLRCFHPRKNNTVGKNIFL